MGYAEVSVNSPIAQRRTFSYALPSGLDVKPGQAVWVPFGNRLLQGIVIELTQIPAVEETRDISGVIETQPLLSSIQISLARWISGHYLSPLFDAVSLMLPPGFERGTLTFFAASQKDHDFASLPPEQAKILEFIKGQHRIGLKAIEQEFGKRKSQSLISQLVKKGLVTRSYELERVKVKPRLERFISLQVSAAGARREVAALKRAAKQAALLEFLAEADRPLKLSEAVRQSGCTAAVIKSLVSKGLVKYELIEVRREPISYDGIQQSFPLGLTPDQKSAFDQIVENLTSENKSTFLLHGITGSGKTEIYLQCLSEAVRLGKRGIVLVPEISLTPQTIARFASRFPHRVAVLHSRLSLGEQFDEWQRIRQGEFDVVIGPRSAIFAPQPDLGLIIIDEEHEWAYKQQETSPHYHARDAALKLAELCKATVILGSATPSLETYYHARRNSYRLLELKERATTYTALPAVEVVNLRDELKEGNRSIFSRALYEATCHALSAGEQVMFFLNRRGGSTFVQCRSCGFVLRCKRCELSLTQHLDTQTLVCHQCNFRTPVPIVCPQCQSRRIKFVGMGTQKLEEETKLAFPGARLLRWDSDAVQKKDGHREIMAKLVSHEADILIGTQMIAKGLDLPLVTLVGIINADTGLNLPDFRSGERAFQLLTQVAGRAGRGEAGGRVIIQTYSPEHYAIQAAAKHDYAIFYEKELSFRRRFDEPPVSRIVSLVFSHTNNTYCQKEAEEMKKFLLDARDSAGIAGLSVLGPAPAFVRRLRGKFRWQIIVRGSDPAAFLSSLNIPRGWIIDVDPVGLA